MYNPYVNFTLYRNPAYSRSGTLFQLSDFLALANNVSSVSGVLISIEVSLMLANLYNALLDEANF